MRCLIPVTLEHTHPYESFTELEYYMNEFEPDTTVSADYPVEVDEDEDLVRAEIGDLVYIMPIQEGKTVARQEDERIYWVTDGEETSWIKNGEPEEARNPGLETLKQTVDQILEEDAEETNISYEENPGLYKGRIGKVLPKSHVRGLSEDIQEGYADLSEYIPSNFDTDPTSEDLARQLARNLRREGLEPSRNGSEIQL